MHGHPAGGLGLRQVVEGQVPLRAVGIAVVALADGGRAPRAALQLGPHDVPVPDAVEGLGGVAGRANVGVPAPGGAEGRAVVDLPRNRGGPEHPAGPGVPGAVHLGLAHRVSEEVLEVLLRRLEEHAGEDDRAATDGRASPHPQVLVGRVVEHAAEAVDRLRDAGEVGEGALVPDAATVEHHVAGVDASPRVPGPAGAALEHRDGGAGPAEAKGGDAASEAGPDGDDVGVRGDLLRCAEDLGDGEPVLGVGEPFGGQRVVGAWWRRAGVGGRGRQRGECGGGARPGDDGAARGLCGHGAPPRRSATPGRTAIGVPMARTYSRVGIVQREASQRDASAAC